MAQNIEQENANNQRFKEVKELIREHEDRIQNLQSSAFQLANYYFVFQGVILAAISNATSLTCSDSWFILTLSVLAAVLNLFALFSIGTKYVRAMNWYDKTWSQYNLINEKMQSSRNQNGAESSDLVSPGNDQRRLNDDAEWIDHFSGRIRYVVLGVCVCLFLAFTGIMVWGASRIICRHDQQRKHPYGDMDCLKLCNGSKCIMFCQDT